MSLLLRTPRRFAKNHVPSLRGSLERLGTRLVSQYLPGGKYILPRDDVERRRLDRQHVYLTKFIYDGRLIYDQNVQLEAGSRVLDAGTGSGAWVLELANELPEYVRLDAVDVSSSNFPDIRPPNVHFSIASVTSLPTEWTGQFDFVTQRLLMAALLATEWPTAVGEFFRVMKPGASLQLIELNTQHRPEGPMLPANAKCFKSIAALSRGRGLMKDCAAQLPALLKDTGFVNIRSEMNAAPVGKSWGEIGTLGAENFFTAQRNMGPALVNAGIVQSLDEWHESMHEMRTEWDHHAGLHYTFTIACARKPLS